MMDACDDPGRFSRRAVLGVGAGMVAATQVGTRAYADENGQDQAPPDVDSDRYVDVQLLNITDFHGYLSPTDVDGDNLVNDGGVPKVVGGAAYLAAHLKRLRAGRRNSIFFSAGDNFAGWPFTVDAHANEPTIEVLNALGLQFSTVGNHELDQRFPEYLVDHIERGEPIGVPGRDSSFPDSRGRQFGGADFSFYSSDVVLDETGLTVRPPYNIVQVDAGNGRKLPIGFIHLTVTSTATGSTSYQPGMRNLDHLETVNRIAAELKAKGVRTIVVNMHEGGAAGRDINALTDPTGPCFTLARAATPDIAAFVTGHWHAAFNGMVPGPDGVPRPVVEAGCHGQMINEITLKLDRRTGAVVPSLTTSKNHANTHEIPPDPRVGKIVNYWVDQGVRRFQTPLAKQSADLTRAPSPLGESAMGNLAADVLLWEAHRQGDEVDLALFATAPRKGSVALAGDGLLYDAGRNAADTAGRILFGEAWKAFGYGNPVLGVTVTGAAILTALQDQWKVSGAGVSTSPLAVSANVSYEVDLAAAPGSRVDPASVKINNQVLEPAQSYRVAALAYTLIAADGTTALADFTDAVRHERDREVFIAYLRAHPTIDPPPLTRVRPAGGTGEGSR
ncbi:bifunctional metallophosphatase/5'-nucleotidase [Microlunatus parietis]|uniref:5'-nucleotidase n=1 Tax=Microlunatus parietis TaxID=682979 RepID=A0A7Y9IDJ9_9ACTN|nr:bifunctional metallophosphatase/5'-nucleotidase [Microlunatus parietis]NYE74844.1 5'-nucleotidase [Microlunatus parietis]